MRASEIIGIMPHCPQEWAEAMAVAMPTMNVDTVLRQAAFVAQIAHESSECTRVKENLNYSADALVKLFSKHFTAEEAVKYQRNPEMIANHLYANRMGNGTEESGDGWKYRGRGPIQLTGKNNYAACGTSLQLPLVEQPDAVLEPETGILTALWFWKSHDLNRLADAGDMQAITKVINGGLLGYDERMKYYHRAMEVLEGKKEEV